MMQANPERWVHIETATQWYNANTANSNLLDEKITALYFMGAAEFTHKFKVQVGIR